MTPRENFMQWLPPGKREAAEAYFDELEGRLSKLESGGKTPAPASLAPKPPATPTK